MKVRNNSTDTKIGITVHDTYLNQDFRFHFIPGAVIEFPNKWYSEIEAEVDLFQELEIIFDATVSADIAIGVTKEFTIGSWILSGEFYYVDLQHNLGSTKLQIELYIDEGSDTKKVSVHEEEVLDSNTIRLWTTLQPDGRFIGRATIININP